MDDFWNKDDFEYIVEAALVSCYESKVLKNRHLGPDALKEKHMPLIRSMGPFIPGLDRCFLGPDDGDCYEFDLKNDRLPKKACLSVNSKDLNLKYSPDSYLTTIVFDSNIGNSGDWKPVSRGTHYKMYIVDSTNRGIRGEFRYFTVGPDGVIYPFDMKAVFVDKFGIYNKVSVYTHDLGIVKQTCNWASIGLQLWADKRFCWGIKAIDGKAKATIGCGREEIKSLLYARDLPMTATGRKKPILHLVESHKRRMRNGTDIDITAFLRGTQAVSIGSTEFYVLPPKVTNIELSENSKRYATA